MQRLSRYVMVIGVAMATLLSGCATTRVSGERLAVLNERLTRMGVCLPRGVFFPESSSRPGVGTAAFAGNQMVSQLHPLLLARVPAVFAASGIDSRSADCPPEGAEPAGALGGYAQILKITPRKVRTGNGGTSLELAGELYHRSNGVIIWRGDITVRRVATALDEGVADEVATKLLADMRREGVVKPGSAVTPAATPADKVAAPWTHKLPIPAATGFAAIDDSDAVPINDKSKERYRHYLTLASPKAFVVYDNGGWRFTSRNPEAMTTLLDQCARDGRRCWLYAVDDRVVWSADVEKRIGNSAQLRKEP